MLSSPYGVGGQGFSANGVTTSRGRLITGVGQVFSMPLLTEGTTRLRVWASQTAPAVVGQGGTLALQAMVRASSAGDNTSDEWVTLLTPIALIPNQPNIVFDTEFSASKIRLALTPFDGTATTMDYILSGGG